MRLLDYIPETASPDLIPEETVYLDSKQMEVRALPPYHLCNQAL